MEVRELENLIEKTRIIFKGLLDANAGRKTIVRCLKAAMNECCGEFEENTLIENLAEEYKLYLKRIAAA